MPSETPTNSPLGVNEAGSRIADILSAKEGDEGQAPSPAKKKSTAKAVKPAAADTAPAKKARAVQPAPEADDQADVEDDETEDDAADDADPTDDEDQSDEDQGSEDDDEGTQDDDAGDDEDDADNETVTVNIDGEEVEVTLKELKSGYMRNSDYTRKTAALAEERKVVEAEKEAVKDLPEVRKRYQAEGERFANNAGLVLAALQARFMPQKPDDALLKTDPVAYYQQKELFQEAHNLVGGLRHEMQKIADKAKTEATDALQKGRAKLMEILPDLKTPENRTKLVSYAEKHGFTREQIAAEPNPILFQWAWKAQKYDDLMAKKATPAPTPGKPKVVKNSTAPANHKAVKQRDRTNAIGTHRQEKSVNSAARAIEKLISS